MAKRQRSTQDYYQKLLDRVQSIDLGGGGYWRPPQGKTQIRVLPPVGGMEFFFVEAAEHYIDNKRYICPAVVSQGEKECPCCIVNDALYQAGEREAASNFRFTRRFWMNIIVRSNEAAGPLILTAGVTIFNPLVALVADPDYADISDLEDGTDVYITREGEGINTEYQVTPRRNATPLSEDDAQIDEWLEDAKDLSALLAERIMDFDEMAKATGAAAFLEGYEDWVPEEDEPEPEDEDDEPQDASDRIAQRLERRRRGRASRGRSPRRRA